MLVYIANFIANKKGLTSVNVVSPCKTLIIKGLFEREMGFEPTTLSLGSGRIDQRYYSGYWWSSTNTEPNSRTRAKYFRLNFNENISKESLPFDDKQCGMSVRCIKD